MASPLTSATIVDTMPTGSEHVERMMDAPQFALLEFFFPGFSVFAGAVQKYLHIDLNLYIPLVILSGALTVIWNYFSQTLWEFLESHFMSVVDIRTDDEIYNILMAWVANQRFAQGARRFVVNTNLNSRSWYLWRWDDDDDDAVDEPVDGQGKQKKALSYTPSFGSHYFWYRGRLLLFRRQQNQQQSSFMQVSEREEISVSCFGRNPWILKQLLFEARKLYMEKDQQKTLIYRGTVKPGSTEPTWQRCMARSSRPLSTVILNEKTKKNLIDDVTDYLRPDTQRWYNSRGIAWRRGYLLHGSPGTGKSSLSLALAGFFKMRIYIVSLSSVSANEENLATLFSELPKKCVVLLEDIDTAGLTHTREENKGKETDNGPEALEPGQITQGNGPTNNSNNGRLSLSGLLNILDGVASQEGRVLIMTTNHLEKLDRALIRPGRVDMIVEFGLADSDMIAAIFRAIYSPMETDSDSESLEDPSLDPNATKALKAEKAKKRAEEEARVNVLAQEFASKIPAHEFSPAELQGHLLRHKRYSRAAIDSADEFITQTRKDKKEKELKDAEEKRKAEEQKKADDAKKQREEEEAKQKKEKEEKKKQRKKAKEEESKESSDTETASSSNESSESDLESGKKTTKKIRTREKLEAESGHKRKDSGYGTPASVEA